MECTWNGIEFNKSIQVWLSVEMGRWGVGPVALTWHPFICTTNSQAPVKERYMGGRGQIRPIM